MTLRGTVTKSFHSKQINYHSQRNLAYVILIVYYSIENEAWVKEIFLPDQFRQNHNS